MSLYVLDTDILTLFRRNHAGVVQQVYAHFLDDLAIAVISAEELITGWLTYIRSARRPDRIAFGYFELGQTVAFLADWILLPFTEQAITRYEHLRSQRLNVGSQDLRIAAIALEQNGTVVTRNLRDFQRVPGLVAENWAA